MKLIILESNEIDMPIFYFTSTSHAAKFFCVEQSNFINSKYNKKGKYKKCVWEWCEADPFSTRFINPDERGITIKDYIN